MHGKAHMDSWYNRVDNVSGLSPNKKDKKNAVVNVLPVHSSRNFLEGILFCLKQRAELQD